MKWSWKFGQEIMPLLVTRRALKEILIEYDGPRLAILEQPPDQILALCIDEDKNGVRWIQSPLSSLEYEALMRGALTVRAALLLSPAWSLWNTLMIKMKKYNQLGS